MLRGEIKDRLLVQIRSKVQTLLSLMFTDSWIWTVLIQVPFSVDLFCPYKLILLISSEKKKKKKKKNALRLALGSISAETCWSVVKLWHVFAFPGSTEVPSSLFCHLAENRWPPLGSPSIFRAEIGAGWSRIGCAIHTRHQRLMHQACSRPALL